MRVSSIIPILLNIINSEQQNQKQAPRQSQVDKTALLNRPLPHSGGTASESTVLRQGITDTNEPLLLPLPIKTPLFPDTQFYVFQKPAGPPHPPQNRQGESGIVFSLSTTNLGRLFFILTQHTDTLRINCHTESKEIATRLTNQSQEIEQRMEELGFAQVVFRCVVLDHQSNPNQTSFTSPGLLDRKV